MSTGLLVIRHTS